MVCCTNDGLNLLRGYGRKPSEREAAASWADRPWTEIHESGNKQAKPAFRGPLCRALWFC